LVLKRHSSPRCRKLNQRFQAGAAIATLSNHTRKLSFRPDTGCGAAELKWFRNANRRHYSECSNQEPLERPRNWTNLAGKVRFDRVRRSATRLWAEPVDTIWTGLHRLRTTQKTVKKTPQRRSRKRDHEKV